MNQKYYSQTEDDNTDEEFVSKSAVKRELKLLQELGAELAELPEQQLKKVELPERMALELKQLQAMRKSSARNRQLRFFAKLLEDEPEVTAELQQLVGQDKESKRQETQRFHQMEQWRDRLIREGDGATAELLSEYPQFDRQQLRQLVRNAQKSAAGSNPADARKLFRFIRDTIEQN